MTDSVIGEQSLQHSQNESIFVLIVDLRGNEMRLSFYHFYNS